MSQLFQDIQTPPRLGSVWRGVINSAPVDFADRVDIRIPEMNDLLVFPELRWMARDAVTLPSPGDPCLAIFDNDNEPWVVAWWPFDQFGE
jgi:hypothetical protein